MIQVIFRCTRRAVCALAVMLMVAGGQPRGGALAQSAFDSDGDFMPDWWEAFFGLDPLSFLDVGADPDGDGRVNLDEYVAGTHPTAIPEATRYFAEGASSGMLDTEFAVANPSATATAHLVFRFFGENGNITNALQIVPPLQRRDVRVTRPPGSAYGTIVESDSVVVIERVTSWDGPFGHGAHAERGMAAPALTWYLAEGATSDSFELFYLLFNPNPTASAVRIQCIRPSGEPVDQTYTVPATSRLTVWVNRLEVNGLQVLANTALSGIVTVENGVPIVVERAMYLTRPGQGFTGGHGGAGVTAPALDWFFAEGAVGPFFDEFLLLFNPNVDPAEVNVAWTTLGAVVFQRANYVIPPHSRLTLWANHESLPLLLGRGTPEPTSQVSARIHVRNGVPIVAERAMWWPAPASTWYESHVVAGAAARGHRWGFAAGAADGPPANAETYFLIDNVQCFPSVCPTFRPATVDVTLLFDDGGPPVGRRFVVPNNGRITVRVAAHFPEAIGRRFGAIVNVVHEPLTDPLYDDVIVVERATYSDTGGVFWGAGTAVMGERLP